MRAQPDPRLSACDAVVCNVPNVLALLRRFRWTREAARLIRSSRVRLYVWWLGSGDGVECPCCGGSFRRFLPYGTEPRAYALCPRCGALERHRLIWLWLERETDLFRATKSVLHVAPEPFLQDALRGRVGTEYLSVDIESSLAMRRMDVTDLDLPDAHFDAVLCVHVLNHVPDDMAAIRELFRVTKPGGWALLQPPVHLDRPVTKEDASGTDPADRFRLFGPNDHVRIYGRDFFDRLRDGGWEVERLDFGRTLGTEAAQRYGLLPSEEIILGRRPLARAESDRSS